MKDNQTVTPTTEQLEALFSLPSGPEPAPPHSADPQPETLSDPEAWVRDFLSDLESPSIKATDPLTGERLNPGMWQCAKAKKQQEMLTAALPAAIHSLRRKLGKTQWEMTFLFGCTDSCYKGWEKGRSVPSGSAMLMMIRLCPDADTLANFGVALPLKK